MTLPEQEAYKQIIDILVSRENKLTKIECELAKENPELFMELYKKFLDESSPQWVKNARAIAKNGNLIEAIKSVRADAGMGLSDAKNYVEAGCPFPVPSKFAVSYSITAKQ